MELGKTERLYYTDAYLTHFDARVVERADDGRKIYLDRTAFYPTSGGQQHDVGMLGGVAVIDVVDEGDRLAHVVSEPPAADAVPCEVDWPRRFDHMQQHTGQHLLSAVFEDLFGARTVSVHFGDETSTLDLEVESLSARILDRAERRVNELIAENRPVAVTFEDSAEATGLRKQVDRRGTLRIVTIAGIDRSACGGTHVRATGEIGSILVRGTERIRKTMRVEFVGGLRAVARARADYLALTNAATALSTSIDSLAAQVANQAAQLKDSEQARRKLEREVAGHRVATLYETTTPLANGLRILALKEAAAMDTLRAFAQAAMDRPNASFIGITPEGQLLVATSEDSGRDAGKIIREALTSVGGKGGGSPRLAQGSAPPAKTTQALQIIRAALARDR